MTQNRKAIRGQIRWSRWPDDAPPPH